MSCVAPEASNYVPLLGLSKSLRSHRHYHNRRSCGLTERWHWGQRNGQCRCSTHRPRSALSRYATGARYSPCAGSSLRRSQRPPAHQPSADMLVPWCPLISLSSPPPTFLLPWCPAAFPPCPLLLQSRLSSSTSGCFPPLALLDCRPGLSAPLDRPTHTSFARRWDRCDTHHATSCHIIDRTCRLHGGGVGDPVAAA